jgi:hypothetical protein
MIPGTFLLHPCGRLATARRIEGAPVRARVLGHVAAAIGTLLAGVDYDDRSHANHAD